MCYYSGWSSGGVCILERSTDSVVWVLEKAFQKTWPYCRNGHHFTVQHLRFSVEESAGSALLETVSGGLLWSVKPKRLTEKGLFQTFHYNNYTTNTSSSSCTWTDIYSAHYLVKWRLDSCTSISLLLKSLSSFRIAACRRWTRRKFEKKLQRLGTRTASSKPWLYLLLACFMHHLGLSRGHEWFCWILFSHHKSLQLPPLETSKSMNNYIQSAAGLLR